MDEELKTWLFDILNSIKEIESFFMEKPKLFADYENDLLLKRAIERNLEIMGEAMNRILKRDSEISITNSRKIVDMLEIHEEVFDKIDCLTCANCCKTTGPLFTQKDIERLSNLFRIKPSQFIEKYLRIDEDNDYVLQSVPCPFLGADNYCSVYEHRPKACREYPHTDRKKFYQINHLTLKNTLICPAAYEVVERMMKNFK